MDQAAGWGKVRVGVDIHSAMVAGVPTSGGSDPNRFTVTDFQVDTARTTCTCPNGVVSTKAYPHGDSDGLSLPVWFKKALFDMTVGSAAFRRWCCARPPKGVTTKRLKR